LLPQVPGTAKFQFLEIGWQIRRPAMMLDKFYKRMKPPIALAHLIIEGTGMMATYISSTEILLKKTVAFHRNENEKMALRINQITRRLMKIVSEDRAYLEKESRSLLTKACIYLRQMETKPTMGYHQYAACM
jgi:hypothetical protein